MSKEIPLTQGKVAIVDDEDYSMLSQYRWFLHTTGCAIRHFGHGRKDRRMIRMHREIMNAPKELQVDHINGDKLDNRRSNLRLATNSQNQMNCRKRYGNDSKYKGVCWHWQNSKWRANIKIDGKQTHLGLFLNEIDAAKAYDDAARKYFGEFAKTNFTIN